MPARPQPTSFSAAFNTCLKSQTGIVVSRGEFRLAELSRDLDRVERLGGYAGDEGEGNEVLKASGEKDKCMSEDLKGSNGLLPMVEKLGPVNMNLSSAAFIKPFFKHLNLSQLNIVSFDADIAQFMNLTNVDVSRNAISAIDFLPPSLKFLKIYNNKITEITCARQPPAPSLCFLGVGHNALTDSSMSQLVQRFRGLLSLDVSYNNLTSLRQLLTSVTSLGRLKHLCAAGNPLCLLPHYRLVVVKNLPTLQLLDEQDVGEAETSDAQLVDHGHLEIPPYLNIAISFSQVTFLKRLLGPLAKELPATRMGDDEIEVPVSEEERLTEVARKGTFFFRLDLPSDFNGEFPDSCVDTTEIAIEEPPPEEPVVKGGKPGKDAVEAPPKPVGEPIDLSGLRRPLPEQVISEVEKAEGADAAAEAEVAPKDSPLFFPLPVADGPNGVDALLQLRDWLRVGMRVKALYRKKKEPIDPDATPAREDAEGEARPATPEVNEARLIGGGILSLSSALWPQISPVPEELRQVERLAALPPTLAIGNTTLTLAPYSMWLEPDVQVPEAPKSKSLSDVSAIVTMEVGLYAKEPQAEVDAEAA